MKPEKLHDILLVISFVIIQIAVKPASSNLSYENKNFVKIKQDPTRFQHASAFRNKKNIFATRYLNTTTETENNKPVYVTPRPAPLGMSRNYSKNQINADHFHNDGVPNAPSLNKKWQVGRVSRKQYEIINMLWRKTKIFVNVESTTPNYNFRRNNETERFIDRLSVLRPFHRLPPRPNLPSSTSSYIEFYYLDESDERVKELTTQKHIHATKRMRERELRNLGDFKFVLADSPIFAFRVDDRNNQQSTTSAIPIRYMQPTNRMKRRRTRTHDSSLTGFDSLNSLTPSNKFPRKRMEQNKIPTIVTSNVTKEIVTLNVKNNTSTTEYIDNETCPITTEALTTFNDASDSENISSHTINKTHVTEPSTANDRIKFFEIYDKHTPIPYYDEKGRLIDTDDVEIFVRGNDLKSGNSERKILLEHVDEGIENERSNPYKPKHAKKHIIDSYKSDSKDQNNDNSVTEIIKEAVTVNASEKVNVTKNPMIKLLLRESNVTNFFEHKKSKRAPWTQYSFAAAYVYEPSQVHCDAAGISPHWLITSGSCLSRHHKNPGGEGRSAFVTYCGETWWNPERVAYVKHSLVHPRFHPRDKTRRHLYNIGLIEVVTSMASACSGWSPISLMSHQFIADVEGSPANAIGWGLDRFDSRYSSNELPKTPLMTYQSQVFSDSCPGNIGYSKAKRLDEEGGIKNVYCLSLPPYSGEKTDPIHGGLLLVGGKLVALYLQEERRPWGDQCAQYTGTWRLVPWVLDVARENEEVDAFTLEI